MFVRGLNTLTDHPNPQLRTKSHHVSDDPLANPVLINTPDKANVQLEQVRLEIREEIEARVTRAEVVDSREEAARAVRSKDIEEMSWVSDRFVLGHLEDDIGQGPPYPLSRDQGRTQAVLGVVDRIGEEVDREQSRKARLDGTFQSPHAAGLVECVVVLGTDPRHHILCRGAVHATHERFVRKDRPACHVDNRLERHCDLLTKRFPVAARAARSLIPHPALRLSPAFNGSLGED